MSTRQLALIATELESDAGASTTANSTASGYWKRIAAALEEAAGATTSANNNIHGYMLRSALAAEAIGGTTGGENANEAGYLKRRDDWITPVRAGGAKVIVTSALPQDTGVNPAHDATYVSTFNAAAIAGFGTEFDGYVDWSKSPISVWSGTNYEDYVHLSATGRTNSLPNFAGEMNRLRGISNTPVILMLADKSGQTASTVITSDPCWLNGLGYGETVAISVTGGEYRIDGGAWTSSAGTAGNCKVELRGTSSATPSGTTNVVFTAGGVSDTFTITTAAAGESASAWTSSTGASKSQYVTVGGTGNLTATGDGGGFASAPHSVRATQGRSGKRQFQATLTVNGPYNKFWIGADNNTDNFNDNFSIPGKDNSTGIALGYDANGPVIYVGGAAVQTPGTPTVFTTGDVLTMEFDTTAGTAAFYRNGTQLGTTVTGLAFGTLHAFVGFEHSHSAVALFVTGQARTLSSGYVPYDN